MSSFTLGVWTYPGIFALVYMAYLFADRFSPLLAFASRIGRRIDPSGASDSAQEWAIYLQKFLGFLLLGPVLVLYGFLVQPDSEMGLGLPRGPWLFGLGLVPLVVFLGISIFRPSSKVPWEFYPQVRQKSWPPRRLVLNSLAWILYLWGYEFAFRGFLFFPLIDAWGFEAALGINIALYSLAHIFKGPGESFGAFFLGIGFCFIAYYTNSFYLPFLLHCILALGNDIKAIKAHPEMTFGTPQSRKFQETEGDKRKSLPKT